MFQAFLSFLREKIAWLPQADEVNATSGIEYIVPILGGLGREGVMAELPALLQVTHELVRSTAVLPLPPRPRGTYARYFGILLAVVCRR